MPLQLHRRFSRKKIKNIKKICSKNPAYQRTVVDGMGLCCVPISSPVLSIIAGKFHHQTSDQNAFRIKTLIVFQAMAKPTLKRNFNFSRKSKYGEGTLYWVEKKIKGNQKPLSHTHKSGVLTTCGILFSLQFPVSLRLQFS